MTATAVEDEFASRSECWCCGNVNDPRDLVRLGNHPEVALCLNCARWVHLQAKEIEDRSKTGLTVRVRDELRSVRRRVVQQGWHRLPVVGPGLRWLGRHLP